MQDKPYVMLAYVLLGCFIAVWPALQRTPADRRHPAAGANAGGAAWSPVQLVWLVLILPLVFYTHLLSPVSVVATAIGACLLAFDGRRFEPSAVLPCFLVLCTAALLPWSRCPEGDSAMDINGVSPPSAWSAIHGPANFQFIPPERRREFLAATARTLNRSG